MNSQSLSRNLTFESCEQRRLLAVDLVVHVDDFEPAEIGEEVTRTVRVFNNGDEDAKDAVVRASFPDLEKVTWERQSGFAQFIANPPDDFDTPPDFVVSGLERPELIGDVNHDGIVDVFAGSPESGFFVVFGGEGMLDESDGLRVSVPDREWLSATALGDVTGDGIDDVLIDRTIVSGRVGMEQLSELSLDVLGLTHLPSSISHWDIHNGGDLNGDGVNEIFVAQNAHPFQDGVPRSGIVLGGESIARIDQKDLGQIFADRSIAIELPVLATGARPIGDVNGDGFQDVALERPPREDTWLYVLLGGDDIANREDFESTTFSVANVLNAETYWRHRDPTGRKIGDANGDGIDDFAIVFEGSFCDDCTSAAKLNGKVLGGTAIVFGRPDIGTETRIDRESDGVMRLEVRSPYLADRADVYSEDRNGDGILDVVLTAASKQYVVFGGIDMQSHQFGFAADVYLGFQRADGYSLMRPSHAIQTDVDNDGTPEWAQLDGKRRLSVWLDPSVRTTPRHSGQTIGGTVPLFDVLDIPFGESVSYTVAGKQRAASVPFFATIAPANHQIEDDYRDNIWPIGDAAYLSVQAEGDLVSGERGAVELKIRNFGPSNTVVKIDEAISTVIEDAAWASETHPFAESIAVDTWLPNFGPSKVLNFVTQGAWRIDGVGDVNGDGFADLYLDYSGIHLGAEDFGAGGGFGNGMSPQGVLRSMTLRRLGDINADGFSDFMVRRPWSEQDPWLLYFGRADLSDWQAIEIAFGDCGSCSLAGDINGDGYPDLVDSSSRRIVFGSTDDVAKAFPSDVNETNSLVVVDDQWNTRLTPIGDVNGDGLADIIVHNHGLDGLPLLFGDDSLQPGSVSVHEVPGIRLLGDISSFSVTPGNHDFNGDGALDLVLDAARAGDAVGTTFVIFGPIDVDTYGQGIDIWGLDSDEASSDIGLVFDGGSPVVGDFNGDGFSDVASSGLGKGTVHFGHRDAEEGPQALEFVSASGDFGFFFKQVGDVNGDGADELIVLDSSGGIRDANSGTDPSGEAKLLFGRRAESRSGVGPINGEFEIPAGGELTINIEGTVKHATSGATVSIAVEPMSGVTLNPLTTMAELVISPVLQGDLDGDGHVSFLDFLTLARSFGRSEATFEDGDIDGDGSVGFLDFVILADNFGRRTSNNS